MIAMLHFATLVVTTIFAAAAAVAFNLILLRVMFVLMRPATVRRVGAPTGLAHGTAQLARAYAAHRCVWMGNYREGPYRVNKPLPYSAWLKAARDLSGQDSRPNVSGGVAVTAPPQRPGVRGKEQHHAGFEVLADDSGSWIVWQRWFFGGLRHIYLGATSAVIGAE